MHGGIELPIGRRCDLTDLITGQRQRLTGGNTSGIGRNVVHHLAAAGIDDFIDSTLEWGSCGGAGDFVVFRSILIDLNLACDCSIFPFDLDGFARRNINGFILLVKDITVRRFQFADIVFSCGQFFINIGISVLIRCDLHDGVPAGIVDNEGNAIDAIAGVGIDLVDEDGTGLAIGDLQCGRLTVLDLNTVERGIQQVAGRSFQLRHSVPAAFGFGEIDDTVAVRCVGADDLTIHLADLELDTRNTLAAVFIALDDLQATYGSVIKIKGLRVVGIDHDGLCAAVLVDDVAGDRFDLCDHHGARNTGNGDLALFVRPV